MINPTLQSIEPIATLLPLRSVIVTLKVLSPFTIGMLHNVQLHGWLRTLSNSPKDFSKSLVIDPLENSHFRYNEGELYRFRLTITSDGVPLLAHILNKITALPESAADINPKQPLQANLELVALHDAFTGYEVSDIHFLSSFGLEELAQQIAPVEDVTRFEIQFLTPALLKKLDSTSSKGTMRFCRNKCDFNWPLLTQRITDTFINLIQTHTSERYARSSWVSGNILQDELLSIWMEYRYGREPGVNKFSGGALAKLPVQLDEPLERWQWAMLIIGQYLGIGQSRGFGLGIYQLKVAGKSVSIPRPTPAHSLLEHALSDKSIDEAVTHNQKKHGFGHDRYQKYRSGAGLNAIKLTENRYFFPALQAVDIPKKNGDLRHLNIPPIEDRILQRTASKLLADTFDSHWMKTSYGYRSGYSRFNARDDINRLIQDGYEWIVEADIRSFFDNINWANIETRLDLLFPNEPLNQVIMQWIKAPIEDREGIITDRTQGLPQGAPIAPVLANLILDDFDSDIQSLGYKLIRYADDFVLLFKTEQEAKNALMSVRASLNEHLLYLNTLKTKVVHYEKGFRFLGFFFVDGYAIETTANVERLEDLTQLPQPQNFSTLVETENVQNKIGDRDGIGIILIITGEVAVLNGYRNQLQVSQENKQTQYSWHSLQMIALFGPHQITTPALRQAMKHKVPIYFISNYGELEGVASSTTPAQGSALWLLQANHCQNHEFALTVSKELVLARISGIQTLIYRRNNTHPTLIKLTQLEDKVRSAQDIDSLRGFEGQAAKKLWAFFMESLDNTWNFSGRNRRPPKDPVNALLSIGYSLIYHLCDTAAQSSGLYPWQGAYHQSHGAHAALASDLMEPFRVVVERTVLTLINRRQLTPDDFSETESGCRISSEARKCLLNALLSELTAKRKKDKVRMIDHMFKQPINLIESFRHTNRFSAWRP